jgi:hypothetical protein
MAETDETRFSNLESRVKKIEDYIECSEKTKEQEWKECICKTLEEIRRSVNSINERQTRARWPWIANLGLTAMIVGTTWAIATKALVPDLGLALLLIFIGLVFVVITLPKHWW